MEAAVVRHHFKSGKWGTNWWVGTESYSCSTSG